MTIQIATLADLADQRGFSLPSARVWASRKVKSGQLVRIRRDLYLPTDSWNRLGEGDLFRLANLIQTPSYVSLTSALSFYGLTSQIPRSVIESLSPVRRKSYGVKGIEFRYLFCRKECYDGFEKIEGFFIAWPEKALVDTLYLVALGRYAFDVAALDLEKLNWQGIEKWVRRYPPRFRKFFKKWRDSLGRSETA